MLTLCLIAYFGQVLLVFILIQYSNTIPVYYSQYNTIITINAIRVRPVDREIGLDSVGPLPHLV